jgi:hypothetical protein
VKPIDHPDRIRQDRRLFLDEAVGRQAAPALAQAHRPARGVEADADPLRGGDRIVERHAIGEQIEVIRAQRAAGQRQLGQAELGGGEDILRPIAAPDRIEHLEPVEQRGVDRPRQGAGQRLEQMMMGVDQPRRDHAAGGIDDGVGLFDQLRQGSGGSHRQDHAFAESDRAIGDLAPGIVHADDVVGIADDRQTHRPPVSAKLCPMRMSANARSNAIGTMAEKARISAVCRAHFALGPCHNWQSTLAPDRL